MAVRKIELKKIWNWLKATITGKDIEWLKRYRAVKWEEFSKENSEEWEKIYTNDIYELSYTIQDVVNAKRDYCHEPKYRFSGGLPKFFLWEIAKILNLDITKDNLKWQLANRIIKEIDRLNKEGEEVYSKAPSVI